MRYLDTKKDLGIHTDIITDDIWRLMRTGAVTNRNKKVNQGQTVGNMVLGSRELYAAVDSNPNIGVYPIDYVSNPFTISKNEEMVSILRVQEVELSGLARVDIESDPDLHSLPSGTDFIEGARRSRNGFTIMALPSTTPDGRCSTIVGESFGKGVFFNRAKVDMVVTEYGSVYLRGLSISERAIALISIAHPKFRKELLKEAKRYHYVEEDQIIPPESGCVYPDQYEFTHTFPDGLEVFFRPVKPTDARRLQKMFYSLSPETIRQRYHGSIKTLSNETVMKMSNIDYSTDMAIIGLVGPRSNLQVIAEGRYMYNPGNNMGEFDVLVVEALRGYGIGTFLANYLKKIAYSRGLAGVYAEVFQDNLATMALMKKVWPTAERQFDSGICIFTLKFPEEDVKRPKDSIIVYSGLFNDFSYGKRHPFRPERAKFALNLIKEEGLLNEPWMRVEEPKMVPKERLIESHDPAFIDALQRANSGEWREEFLQYNLGGDDTPVFPGMFDYILLYTSATLTGVDLIVEEDANVVFSLLGGFHHASRRHAEGFCYINDIIVAIDTLLAHGLRVACIDIDAHHGNGVQDAYYKDDRVLTISLHESGKTLYPWGGFENEVGEGAGEGFNINVPLPPGTDDEAYEWVFDSIINYAVESFAPNVLVVVVGADTHKNDPLANLSLTNNGMMEVMKRMRGYANHMLLLPGGGYDVNSTSKAWGRVWAAANRMDSLPDYLLVMGGTFLGSEGLQGAQIIDRAYRITGDEKNDILDELERIIHFHEKHTLPIIRGRSQSGSTGERGCAV
jgi:acetoin utilization deacetylase AcuC-like enzyme